MISAVLPKEKNIEFSISLKDLKDGTIKECFRIRDLQYSVNRELKTNRSIYEVDVLSGLGEGEDYADDTFIFDREWNLIGGVYRIETANKWLKDLYYWMLGSDVIPLEKFAYILLGEFFLKEGKKPAIPDGRHVMQKMKAGILTEEQLNGKNILLTVFLRKGVEEPYECMVFNFLEYNDVLRRKRIFPTIWQMRVKFETLNSIGYDYFNWDRDTKELLPDSVEINNEDHVLTDLYTTFYDKKLMGKDITMIDFAKTLMEEYFCKEDSFAMKS